MSLRRDETLDNRALPALERAPWKVRPKVDIVPTIMKKKHNSIFLGYPLNQIYLL